MCPMLMIGIVDMVRLKWVRRTIAEPEGGRKENVQWLMDGNGFLQLQWHACTDMPERQIHDMWHTLTHA
jgi:hypothetical protein